MVIKAVICTIDAVYAQRLSDYFDKEFGSKIELDLCNSIDSALALIHQRKNDIALFDDYFMEQLQKVIKDIPCVCAVLKDQIYESDQNMMNVIEKYQRGDKIYKDIIEVYSAAGRVKRVDVSGEKDRNLRICVFFSASGGTGTTTIARAYARRYALYEKVLLLNLGLFHLDEAVEGNPHGLDEVLLTLKSRRNILPYKLQSAVSKAKDRVYTFGTCSNAIDLLELNKDDMVTLLDGIGSLSEYSKVVIDMGTELAAKEIELLKKADQIIYVTDDSEACRKKYKKFMSILSALEKKEQVRLERKLQIFENKIRQGVKDEDEWADDKSACWAPYVSAASNDAVIERIAESDSFSSMEIRHAE